MSHEKKIDEFTQNSTGTFPWFPWKRTIITNSWIISEHNKYNHACTKLWCSWDKIVVLLFKEGHLTKVISFYDDCCLIWGNYYKEKCSWRTKLQNVFERGSFKGAICYQQKLGKGSQPSTLLITSENEDLDHSFKYVASQFLLEMQVRFVCHTLLYLKVFHLVPPPSSLQNPELYFLRKS